MDLDKIGIDFKEVFYETKASESILLTNTGSVVAHFRLVPKLEEVALCKPWISVNPSFGMLIPGESAKINFTVNVDNATATKLNMGKDIFEVSERSGGGGGRGIRGRRARRAIYTSHY